MYQIQIQIKGFILVEEFGGSNTIEAQRAAEGLFQTLKDNGLRNFDVVIYNNKTTSIFMRYSA